MSCFPRYYNVPKGIPILSPSPGFKGGTGQVDITPPPGTSMAGYGSDIGQITRGHFGRLYAKSFYLEDDQGHYVIITACDMWAFPQGLGDRVMRQLLKNDRLPFTVARENVIFSATHTHNGQGNYSTSFGYNEGSSTYTGFDKEQFWFLIDRITLSIEEAVLNKQQAHLKYTSSIVPGLSRNRSIDSWRANPIEDQNIFRARIPSGNPFVRDNASCVADDPDQYVAVDPQLTTIVISRAADDIPIGVINNFGMHPTAMGAQNPLASADIFGVACLTVTNYLKSQHDYSEGTKPVVAMVNGAEGDISADWQEHSRRETLRLGDSLSNHIVALLQKPMVPISDELITRLEFKDIRDQRVDIRASELMCNGDHITHTAKVPVIGKSILAGAEDGRVEKKQRINECCYIEAKRSDKCHGTQGHKEIFKISKIAASSAPRYLPVGVYDLGSLRIVTMPGEVTVTLGERIKAAVRDEGKDVILFGLTNEYTSYLTTPAEYDLQNYEGGSTIYGQASGAYLEEEAKRVRTVGGPLAKYYGVKVYRPSSIFMPFRKRKLRREFKNHSFTQHDVLCRIGCHKNFTSSAINWGQVATDDRYDIPHVTVEEQSSDGSWKTVVVQKIVSGKRVDEAQSDTESYNVIVYTLTGHGQKPIWNSIWLPPSSADPSKKYRMKYESRNVAITSPLLQLSHTL